MGEVWLGRRRLGDGSDQPVAIKLISAKAAAQPGGLKRFNREARLWLTLHHANVVALYDFVRQEGEQFMVMEYVDGLTLGDLAGWAELPYEVLRLLLLEALLGLEYIHGRGVLHRDISPANVLVSRDGEVKLSDFGLAKLAWEPRSEGFRGTAAYASLEALGARALDASSDLYSLAAVFYRLLMGSPPYGRGDRDEIARRHRERRAAPLPERIPLDLRTIIASLLRPWSERGHRTASEVLNVWQHDDTLIATASELAQLVQEAMERRNREQGIESPGLLSTLVDGGEENRPEERASIAGKAGLAEGAATPTRSARPGRWLAVPVAAAVALAVAPGARDTRHQPSTSEESRVTESDKVYLAPRREVLLCEPASPEPKTAARPRRRARAARARAWKPARHSGERSGRRWTSAHY